MQLSDELILESWSRKIQASAMENLTRTVAARSKMQGTAMSSASFKLHSRALSFREKSFACFGRPSISGIPIEHHDSLLGSTSLSKIVVFLSASGVMLAMNVRTVLAALSCHQEQANTYHLDTE